MSFNPFTAKSSQGQSKIKNFWSSKAQSVIMLNNKPRNNIFSVAPNPIQSQQENVNQNIPQPPKVSIGIVQTMDFTRNLSIPPIKSAQKIKNFPSSKLELAVKIQGVQCKVVEHQQIKKISDLKKEVIALDLQNTKKAVVQNEQLLQKLQNCLSQLYENIRCNTKELLLKIKSSHNKTMGFIFNQIEFNRLIQGLMFYKPSKAKTLQILENILTSNQWGMQAKVIAKSYNLDILKGYYVVKQVYRKQNKIPNNLRGFKVDLKSNQFLDERTLIKLAGQFLKDDKINLLLCYGEYMTGSFKPNQTLRVDQEIKILWANIQMLKNQSPQVQQMIFQLFVRYSSYNHPQSYVLKDFASMKSAFAKANQTFKTQLVENRMEQMLEKNQFNVQDCKGHYLDLVQLLTRHHQIDFEAAFKRLSDIQILSQKWIPLLKLYLNEVQFNGTKITKIWKAAYLYKLIQFFQNKKLLLTQNCEHNLLKNIYTNVSIILGLKFLEVVTTKSLQTWCLKFLSKFNEKNLLQIQNEESVITNTIFKADLQRGNIIKIFVQLIDKVVRQYIDSQDFIMLETEISSGKSLIFNFNENQTVYQSVKFYIKMFFKLPSYQAVIQANIINLFKKLKDQNINIKYSFQYYNSNLLAKLKNAEIIANHISFIIEFAEPVTKTRLIYEWFCLLERLNFSFHVQEFRSVLIRMNDNIDFTQNLQMQMQTLLKGINLFKDVVLQDLLHAKTAQSVNFTVNIGLICGNILNWYSFIQKEVPEKVLEFFKEIKYEMHRLIINPIEFLRLQSNGLQITKKLMLLHSLLEDQNENIIHYQFQDKQKCRISDIINRQRTHNLYQLYNYISCQFKKQNSHDVINALYAVTEMQQSLAKLLIQQNGVEIAKIISQPATKFNLLLISKLIKIAISTYSYSFSQPCQVEKQNCLINCIQDRVFLQLKGQKFTIPLFRNLFKLLVVATNSMPYQYHMVYIEQAINTKLLLNTNKYQIESLGMYAAYLLCLFLGRNKNKICLSNEIQRNQFVTQVTMFVEIEHVLLQYHNNYRTKQFDQFQLLFIKKINKIILECKEQPYINNICLKLVRKVKDSLINFRNSSKFNKFFEQELTTMIKFSEIKSQHQQNESQKASIQYIICKDEEQFNSTYANFIKFIENKTEGDQIQQCLTKIMSFFNQNNKYLIKNMALNKNFLLKLVNQRQVVFQVISFLNVLIDRLHPTKSSKNNVSLIKEIVKELSENINQCKNIEQIVFTKSVVQLGTKIIRKNIVSAFWIVGIYNPHLTLLLANIRQNLFKWSNSENQQQLGLNQFEISLRFYPKGIGFQKTFTLLNLLQYRQKLELLFQMLEYSRQANGLIQLKDYGLVQAIVEFISFWKENRVDFNTKENVQKVKVLNHLLNSRKRSGYLSTIKSQFICKEISAKCQIIARYLYELNFDFNYYEINFFDQLKLLESNAS